MSGCVTKRKINYNNYPSYGFQHHVLNKSIESFLRVDKNLEYSFDITFVVKDLSVGFVKIKVYRHFEDKLLLLGEYTSDEVLRFKHDLLRVKSIMDKKDANCDCVVPSGFPSIYINDEGDEVYNKNGSSVNFGIDSLGDLHVYGSGQEKYYIDNNGDLQYGTRE